jgi:probable phosphoglycerate mutase
MAERVGVALRNWQFSRVLTSPLTRALDTCRIAGFGDRAEVRGDLREWDYGAYDGLTSGQIRMEQPGWTVWRGPIPNGESIDEVGRRCCSVVADLRASQGTTAVFSHGHALRILAACWLDLPYVDGRLFLLDAGAISILGYEHEQPVLTLWNSTAHLSTSNDTIPGP